MHPACLFFILKLIFCGGILAGLINQTHWVTCLCLGTYVVILCVELAAIAYAKHRYTLETFIISGYRFHVPKVDPREQLPQTNLTYPALCQGYKAGQMNLLRIENPYLKGTLNHLNWNHGFRSYEVDNQFEGN